MALDKAADGRVIGLGPGRNHLIGQVLGDARSIARDDLMPRAFA
jgi:hypothetical protein